MVRKKLSKLEYQLLVFTGRFRRYGIKQGYQGREIDTALFVNILNKEGEKVTDHVWFNKTKGFQQLGMVVQGQLIQFEARVKEYFKGYINPRKGMFEQEKDYKLNYPTKFKKV